MTNKRGHMTKESGRLTESELAAIEARAAKATEGPWVNMPDGPFWGEIKTARLEGEGGWSTIAEMPEADDREADFDFIAAAREDVPALVAEIRRLRTALGDIYDAAESLNEARLAALEALGE
jgi:hypothetical protein